jgi:hypothetical protein
LNSTNRNPAAGTSENVRAKPLSSIPSALTVAHASFVMIVSYVELR